MGGGMTFHDICGSCEEYACGYCDKYKEYTGRMDAHHPECGKLRFWEYEEPADEKEAEFARNLRAALKNLREALSCGETDVESLTYNYKFPAVSIRYQNGYGVNVNVKGDSVLVILKDVLERIKGSAA
jgi:hypothetical protein